MARDDSILYSGASSASFGHSKQQPIRKSKSDEKREKRSRLQPAATVVFEEIEKEKNAVMFLQNIDIENAVDERMFMVEVMARKKYVEYLQRLQNKLDNILREPRPKVKVTPLPEAEDD